MSTRRLLAVAVLTTSAAVASTAPVAVASTPPAAVAPTKGHSNTLTCSISTASRGVSFNPPLRLQRRPTAITATLALRDCRSPNGRQRHLRSGTLRVRGAALAGCTGARDLRGTAAITWRDQHGRHAGTSRLASQPGTQVRSSLADALLASRVTSGPLKGHDARGGIIPRGDLLRCHNQGLGTVHGTGRITFA
ncbi:hypothetical protein [Actinomadura sp. 6N118]|uniref:hypothetical protein n=1 Tax=Actinomadura sp. 6N118 TaxID=3375151 RepID=UPI0037BB6BE8